MKKQPEITDATRKNIIDAFWRLFEKTDIDLIPIKALAAEANVHRSSFYRYFPDIYAVLENIEDELLETLKDEVHRIITENPNITVTRYSELMVRVMEQYADKLYRLLNHSKGASFKKRLLREIHAQIERNTNLTKHDIRTDFFKHFISSVMLMNFNFWYTHKDSISLAEVIALGQELMAEGLSRIVKIGDQTRLQL
jgi:AcrR family transcriptional regulator